MWVVLAPAAALWFAAIVIVNVARSPQDTLPPELTNPDTTDTTDTTDTPDATDANPGDQC